MVERGYLSAPLPVTALGASDGNRTHVSALARPRTNRCTTPAWYLRSHLGSSEIKPHPGRECVFMLANGTNYGEWCAMTGSNRRPLACKANALPAELIAHMELMVGIEPTAYSLPWNCSTTEPHQHIKVATALDVLSINTTNQNRCRHRFLEGFPLFRSF